MGSVRHYFATQEELLRFACEEMEQRLLARVRGHYDGLEGGGTPDGAPNPQRAIRMLEEGVASAEDIDTAMTLGYKHPVGPLRLTDIVGLDVRLGIAEELARELGPRFEPPALLRRMVAEGRLGRKSGEGFYDWKEEN